LEYLASIGVDLNQGTWTDETPLHTAILSNTHECIQFLLDQGVFHLGTVLDDGSTTLHYAAQGDAETMNVLARAKLPGFDPKAQNKAGLTPLEVFDQRNIESEELLLAWANLLEAVELANSPHWLGKATVEPKQEAQNDVLIDQEGEFAGEDGDARDSERSAYEEDETNLDDGVEVFYDALDHTGLEKNEYSIAGRVELVA
jgi:Ankyrin repeats (3 copies)